MAVPWEKDHEDPKKCSQSILMDWLTTEGNYARWTGSDGQRGETKETLLTEIRQKMEAVGIHGRTNADIRSRIATLQHRFREANDWLNNTGAGLRSDAEEQGDVDPAELEKMIKGTVLSRYFNLL